MSETRLPISWCYPALSEILDVKGGFAFKSKDYKTKGFPLLRISNIQNRTISFEKDTVYIDNIFDEKLYEYFVTCGDILIALSGATTGKYGIYNLKTKALLNQRVGRLKLLLIDEINSKYIYYYLDIIRKSILEKAYGAAQPNISPTVLASFQIPLPPLNEQHRIVEKIEELFTKLDSAVTELKNVKKQLKRYRQSVLKSAFEGKLTEEWRKENNVNNSSWVETNLGTRIKVSSGNGLTSRDMFEAGKYPVYGGNGIAGFYDKYLFDVPKLILGRVGAKCGVVHITDKYCWVTDNALVVTFLTQNDNIKFYYYLLDYHDLNKLSVSTAQPVISGSKIYPYEVKIPSLSEQQKIVEEIESRLSVADKIEEEIDSNLKKTEQLRQSILKKAFEGKLVPQDPNDEPAEKLLERIKKEKQKNDKK